MYTIFMRRKYYIALDIDFYLLNCSLYNIYRLCGYNLKCVEFNKFKYDILFGV